MSCTGLIAFWIKPPFPSGPYGLGVTARSLADALAILRAVGYGRYLPDSLEGVQITEGITVGQLDAWHVATNMGPISVRGIWYPFAGVGVPAWAEERINAAATLPEP